MTFDEKDKADRVLLVIPAMPTSGTSALAGVLEKLGVYMGEYDNVEYEKRRGYEMFEDTRITRFSAVPNDDLITIYGGGKIMATQVRIRSYINWRFLNDPPGPIGVKLPANYFLYDPDIASLPIATLDVDRPLELAIERDREHLKRSGYKDKYPPGGGQWGLHEAFRASDIAACRRCKEVLFEFHPPVAQMTFDELVEHREVIIPKLAEALQLNPTPLQLNTAIAFVDPNKKHS